MILFLSYLVKKQYLSRLWYMQISYGMVCNAHVHQLTVSLVNFGEVEGAFHYAKDSGNFGWNSNGKVRFGFF